MRQIIMLDEGMRILEEGIVKAKNILIGHPLYNWVYTMCSQRPPYAYSGELYDRYRTNLEESIVSVVLSSLNDKHNACLLAELLQMWENYKVMTKCLSRFFLYLDQYFVRRRNIPSLGDLAIHSFRDLIHEEQNGKQFQQDLLKQVMTIFWKLEGKRGDYYEAFEQIMLEDAASYYSQLASKLLYCDSSTDYIQKVAWLLEQERKSASQYSQQGSLEKLLETVKGKLMGETEPLLIKRMRAVTQQSFRIYCQNVPA